VDSAKFWQGFNDIVADLAPKNIALLAERDRIQTAMDQWHTANPGPAGAGKAMKAYRKYLSQIGYLVPEPKKVQATTANVDAELAKLAGPQLVVPILNARYALNAANARWGSLYDALYGTDAISEADGCEKGAGYNPKRGAKVIDYCRNVLDRCAPLKMGSHVGSKGYSVCSMPSNSWATPAPHQPLHPCCSCTTASTLTCKSTSPPPLAKLTPLACPT
jgi:malate synthase